MTAQWRLEIFDGTANQQGLVLPIPGQEVLPVEIELLLEGHTVKDILAEGTGSGEFRRTEPVMTHLTLVGALLMLNVVSPLRERFADLGSTIDVPDADTDIARFLGDLLLQGIAAPRSGESK